MKKAIIIYQSKKGTTQQLGNEINQYLTDKGIKTEIKSVHNFNSLDLSSYDYVFLGCWTKGLMIFAQHPDRDWKKFVRSLEIPDTAMVALFTTYKIATGSMFSQMEKQLPEHFQSQVIKIKSRDGSLPKETQSLMENYIRVC